MLLICLSKSKAQILESSFVLFISKKTVFAYENLQPVICDGDVSATLAVTVAVAPAPPPLNPTSSNSPPSSPSFPPVD